jgi:hypothetical protein
MAEAAFHGCLCEELREALDSIQVLGAWAPKGWQTRVTTLTPSRCTGKFVRRLTGRSDPLGL